MPSTPSGPIITSVFELFKSGPGPSSSHTMGPMAAGCDFKALLDALPADMQAHATGVRVRLFGSLSATGQGHGTDKAVLTGLLGFTPDHCPPHLPSGVYQLPEEERRITLGGKQITLGSQTIIFDSLEHPHPYSNTLSCELLGDGEEVLFSRVYYSVGGGFLQWEGWTAPERGKPLYPYSTCGELQAHVRRSGLNIAQIVLQNEVAITGLSGNEVIERLEGIAEIMRKAVARGLAAEGVLPGNLNVYRKAGDIYRAAHRLDDQVNRFLALLNAYSFSVAEENAAGGIIVTAPTCGSAGVMPAMLSIIEKNLALGSEAVHSGLLAAAAIGFLAKRNAGIAGAEVGCQGEIGVASAMAAAMLAQARGYSARIVENAAEIALEHHLGLTCDPVGGYVQIPCIERNAMGTLKAYNAVMVAVSENIEHHRVTLDATIQAMGETGRDMSSKYKETSLGGLATSMVNC